MKSNLTVRFPYDSILTVRFPYDNILTVRCPYEQHPHCALCL